MEKRQSRNQTGPAGRYKGCMVDLMDKLMGLLGLRYKLYPVAEGRYGYRHPDGSWDGMVGELLEDVSVRDKYCPSNKRETSTLCWFNVGSQQKLF